MNPTGRKVAHIHSKDELIPFEIRMEISAALENVINIPDGNPAGVPKVPRPSIVILGSAPGMSERLQAEQIERRRELV